MSLSNRNDRGVRNPATRWFEWNGVLGTVRYYDKDAKENVDVGHYFTFILLDQLATIRAGSTQKFSFTISRRISGRDGAFAGILVAAIETDDFTNFVRNIAIGENGGVAVWRMDGRLILRQPMEDEYLNKDFSYLKVFKVPLQESPSGVFFNDKTVDGIGRLVAYQKMKELPLLVVTSIPSASIRRAWYANVKNYSVIAALSLCGLVALAWLVYKSVAKEESARREVETAHDKLAQLNAELEQRILDRTSQLVSANRDLSNEINERKRAEEEWRESERRFRAPLRGTTIAPFQASVGRPDGPGTSVECVL